jgi:hypothetical protein
MRPIDLTFTGLAVKLGEFTFNINRFGLLGCRSLGPTAGTQGPGGLLGCEISHAYLGHHGGGRPKQKEEKSKGNTRHEPNQDGTEMLLAHLEFI